MPEGAAAGMRPLPDDEPWMASDLKSSRTGELLLSDFWKWDTAAERTCSGTRVAGQRASQSRFPVAHLR
jgi:hypothetical protein